MATTTSQPWLSAPMLLALSRSLALPKTIVLQVQVIRHIARMPKVIAISTFFRARTLECVTATGTAFAGARTRLPHLRLPPHPPRRPRRRSGRLAMAPGTSRTTCRSTARARPSISSRLWPPARPPAPGSGSRTRAPIKTKTSTTPFGLWAVLCGQPVRILPC